MKKVKLMVGTVERQSGDGKVVFDHSRRVFFACLFCLALVLFLDPFRAGWAQEANRFRFGLTIGTEQQARDRIEPFRLYLEEALDRPVDLFLFPTMNETAEALLKDKIDYARLSPMAYAALAEACDCVKPLVTARPDNYPARFYGILLARTEDSEKGLYGFEGGRLGVGPLGSVATRLVPLVHLQREGIELESFFSKIVTIATPQAGIEALKNGELDLVAAWSTLAGDPESGFSGGTLHDLHLAGGDIKSVTGVWLTPPLPYTAHTARSSLSSALRADLQSALMDLPQSDPDLYSLIEPNFEGGFEPVTDEDYKGLQSVAACPGADQGKPCAQ